MQNKQSLLLRNQSPKNWQKVKLGDVSVQITDGKHGDCVNENDSGYFFISSKDVFGGSIHYENARQITEVDFFDTHRRTKLEIGDVLITNSGTIGRMALIKNNARVERTTFQKSVAIIKPKRNSVDSVYLYYRLLSLNKQLINLGGGSAQHNLLLGDLRNFTIQIPDLSTQTRIASILSAFDDKIEVNNKIAKTLEEMAQAFFKEWFVKFRFPGYEKAEFVESELGKIPKGWEVGKIKDLIDIISGYPFSSKLYDIKEGLGVVTIKNVQDGKFVTECDSFIKQENLPRDFNIKCYLKNGDIILSLTGNVGRVCFVYGGEYLLNQRVAKLVPRDANNFAYCYFLFRHRVMQNYLINMAKGSAQPNLSPIETANSQLLIPSTEILAAFKKIAGPIYEQFISISNANMSLAALRDLLLPKLMKGEIKV